MNEEEKRARARENRKARFALRALVDGRWVATHIPDKYHGDSSLYTNWGCRCRRCTAAHVRRCGIYKERARARKKAGPQFDEPSSSG